MSNVASTGIDVPVTSSVIPTVKWFFGMGARRFSRTARTIAGVNSLDDRPYRPPRSEEHTSELQSRQYLVCRLLLEKKKNRHRLLATTHPVICYRILSL